MMNDQQADVIAIDGPSGAGKGTISEHVARKLGWHFLDSGALYRLVALAARNHSLALDDDEALETLARHLDVQFITNSKAKSRILLEGEEVTDEIRSEQCGCDASVVAAIPGVREALLERQRAFCTSPGLVADGRDMGTTVFPDARLKIFLTASAEERAKRRYNQLKEKGLDVNLPSLLEEIQARDARDSQRTVSPLKAADEAITVDTTNMSIQQVIDHVMKLIRSQGLVAS
jgi:cytidylate kinase